MAVPQGAGDSCVSGPGARGEGPCWREGVGGVRGSRHGRRPHPRGSSQQTGVWGSPSPGCAVGHNRTAGSPGQPVPPAEPEEAQPRAGQARARLPAPGKAQTAPVYGEGGGTGLWEPGHTAPVRAVLTAQHRSVQPGSPHPLPTENQRLDPSRCSGRRGDTWGVERGTAAKMCEEAARGVSEPLQKWGHATPHKTHANGTTPDTASGRSVRRAERVKGTHTVYYDAHRGCKDV